MNLREVSNASATNTAFTATLTLTVEDSQALWNAAAEKALQAGMALSDVLDTIGPREDPAIGDCLAMLLVPAGIAGCALDDFAINEKPAAIATAEIIPMPLTRAASR